MITGVPGVEWLARQALVRTPAFTHTGLEADVRRLAEMNEADGSADAAGDGCG